MMIQFLISKYMYIPSKNCLLFLNLFLTCDQINFSSKANIFYYGKITLGRKCYLFEKMLV